MPMSCKCILDRMVHKGAMTIEEREKILRNLRRGWIAFKDEPPQVNISMLVCDVDGDIYISHRTMSDSYYDETGNRLKNLRAWMPLPEPYKEVDE